MDENVNTGDQSVTIEIPETPAQEVTPPVKPQVDTVVKPQIVRNKKGQNKGDEVFADEIELYRISSEIALEKYVYENINELWKGLFDEEVVKATRQYNEKISQNIEHGYRGLRADLFVECQSGNKYLVEIKNPDPKNPIIINAIGQILYYGTVFPEGNKLVIISTSSLLGIEEVIKKFNLPLDFILFGKDKVYLLKK
jgi:hypothetical protein